MENHLWTTPNPSLNNQLLTRWHCFTICYPLVTNLAIQKGWTWPSLIRWSIWVFFLNISLTWILWINWGRNWGWCPYKNHDEPLLGRDVRLWWNLPRSINMGIFRYVNCDNLSETIPLDQNQHYPLVICYITIENCPFSSWIYSLNMDLSIAFCMFTRPATETPALVTSA